MSKQHDIRSAGFTTPDELNRPDAPRLHENQALTLYHPYSRRRPSSLHFLSEIRDRILGMCIASYGILSKGIPMPTILLLNGWRFHFFANEGTEPIHVHCIKGEARGKFWLRVDGYDVIEANSKNMKPADMRTVRKIIFDHFDYFVAEWNAFEERKNG